MITHSIPVPKIRPAQLALKPDGTIDDHDRVEIGPTPQAFQEWAQLGLTPPNLPRLRQTRLNRIVAQLQQRDYAGVLLFDPVNIRYATDCPNMQVWIAHNPARAAFVGADGHVILWDFHGCGHMSAHLELIQELRTGAGFSYFLAGDTEVNQAQRFAQEIAAVMQQHGGRNRRLAVDRIEVAGVQALMTAGVKLRSGQQLMEQTRTIKCTDEVNAMRCALATCETAIAAMESALSPGLTEVELWSVLQAENIKRGGEWIETRLLSSGPRTNPWMQEAGPRTIHAGDLVAFDTDMIGPYGMAADISRTWYCGDDTPSDRQRELYQLAYEQLTTNMAMLKPGVSFKELSERAHRLPAAFQSQRYSLLMHGIGLCDEFPVVYYPEDWIDGAFEGSLQPGMTLCVEAYAGAEGDREGVKLENQVLITETGYENLTHYPFDARLLQ
ncbi:MAG: Xaa-Pro peptidase family protein [Elainellaceae cyanobacterium]